MSGTREPGIDASVKEGVSRRNGNLPVEPLEDTGPRARETGTGGLVLFPGLCAASAMGCMVGGLSVLSPEATGLRFVMTSGPIWVMC